VWQAAGVSGQDARILEPLVRRISRSGDRVLSVRRLTDDHMEIRIGWQAGPLTGSDYP
jgi:hypothetical protein